MRGIITKIYLLFQKHALLLLAICISLFLFRMSVPYLKYLFVPFSIIYIGLLLPQFFLKGSFINAILRFSYHNLLFLILLFIYLIVFLVDPSKYTLTFKEAVTFIIITILVFLVYHNVKSLEANARFIEYLELIIIYISILISILGMLKYLSFMDRGFFGNIWISKDPTSTALVTDYNFYILTSILAIISLTSRFSRINYDRLHRISWQLVLLLFSTNLILSASRRGFVFYITFLLFLLVIHIRDLFKLQKNRIIIQNTRLYFLVILAITAVMPILVSTRVLNTSSENTAILLVKYLSVFGKGLEDINQEKSIYKDLKPHSDNNLIYNGNFQYGMRFWGIESDSTFAEEIQTPYGNGLRIHRTDGDDGNWSLRYRGRPIIYYSGHKYTISLKYRVIKGNEMPFRIGWWVDDGGYGYSKTASLQTTITDLGNGWHEIHGSHTFIESHLDLPTVLNSLRDYSIIEITDISITDEFAQHNLPIFADELDLSYHEMQNWLQEQNLQYYQKPNLFYNGDFKFGLTFWEPMADSTYHELITTPYGNHIRVTRTDGDGGYWSLYYNGPPIEYKSGSTYRIDFDFKVIRGNGVPFKVGWWVNDGDRGFRQTQDLTLAITDSLDGWQHARAEYTFLEDHSGIATPISDFQDFSVVDFANIKLLCLDDLADIPDFLSQVIAKKEHRTDSIITSLNNRRLIGSRLSRWYFTYLIFSEQYSWKQKIFGGGFNYLKQIGKKFHPEEDRLDWPHNPFLSTFMYSGIFGGIVYLLFLFLVIYYYIKYYRYHRSFFFMFLLVFFFSFLSGNNPTDPPILGFFSLIPFFTRYLVKNIE